MTTPRAHHFPPLAAVAAAAALAVACAFASGPARAESLLGLTTSNALFAFDSGLPGSGSALTAVTGLGAGETLLAIDLRPTTGVVYGLSSASNVYSISLSGAAALVGTLSSPLASTVVGFDFNPVADLAGGASLRIVGNSGQNYAFNVATGDTLVATAVQPSFSAVAYGNNDINPGTGTALYYVDGAADQLKVATTAFNAPTINPVGALGVDVGDLAGFDISSSGTAFAVLSGAQAPGGLYTINLASGAATFAGAVGFAQGGASGPTLVGLTAITPPIPEPQTYALMLAGLAVVGWVARRRARRGA